MHEATPHRTTSRDYDGYGLNGVSNSIHAHLPHHITLREHVHTLGESEEDICGRREGGREGRKGGREGGKEGGRGRGGKREGGMYGWRKGGREGGGRREGRRERMEGGREGGREEGGKEGEDGEREGGSNNWCSKHIQTVLNRLHEL